MFLVPAKKGKKRKAQREEEYSNKSQKMLTSKEVCVFYLKHHSGIESREEEPHSYGALFLKLVA